MGMAKLMDQPKSNMQQQHQQVCRSWAIFRLIQAKERPAMRSWLIHSKIRSLVVGITDASYEITKKFNSIHLHFIGLLPPSVPLVALVRQPIRRPQTDRPLIGIIKHYRYKWVVGSLPRNEFMDNLHDNQIDCTVSLSCCCDWCHHLMMMTSMMMINVIIERSRVSSGAWNWDGAG